MTHNNNNNNNPLSPTRDEENRRLAEFAGFTRSLCGGDLCWHSPGQVHFGSVPDFYESEAANALLLDKLLKSIQYKQILLDAETCFTDQPRELNECEQDHEACIFAHLHIYIHDDLKTAIVKAALAYLEAQKS